MPGFARIAAGVVLGIGIGLAGLALGGATPTGAMHAGSPPTTTTSRASLPSSPLAFAKVVLGEAPMPADSAVIHSVPKSLDKPPQVPGVPGLIDLHRYFRTTEVASDVKTDVTSRLPPGAKLAGSGSAGGEGASVSFFFISLATSGPNEYLAELDYSVVATGTGALVRLDAQSVFAKDRQSAESIPLDARATLTGYRRSSLAKGSRGPVTARLDRAESVLVIRVLNALPPGEPPECMEDVTVFEIRFTLPGEAPFEVSEDGCEATVQLGRAGTSYRPLQDRSCALVRLVASLLPKAAEATRATARGCRPGTL